MRELRVEDALLYLDQVKVEFGDRPHIYNEFLDIMKTFKTQQIDTPGVIRRVSNLFQGNRRLVLGFNTFLPEGYKIEIPMDGDGPPVAVYRAPGSNVAHILRESAESQAVSVAALTHQQHQQQQAGHAQQQLQQQQQHPHPQSYHPGGMPPQRMSQQQTSPPSDPNSPAAHQLRQHQQQMHKQQHPLEGWNHTPKSMVSSHDGGAGRPLQRPMDAMEQPQIHQLPGGVAPRQPPPKPTPMGATPNFRPSPLQQQQQALSVQPQQQQQQQAGQPSALGNLSFEGDPNPPGGVGNTAVAGGQPLEFDHAINYVTTIKRRFAAEPDTYKKFLEILHTYQKEQRGIKEVLDEVSELFEDHPDLLKEFTFFLPDAVQSTAKLQLEQVARESEVRKRLKAKTAIMTTAQGMQRQAQTTLAPLAGSGLRSRPLHEIHNDRVAAPSGGPYPEPPTRTTTERDNSLSKGAQYGTVLFDPVRPPRKKDRALAALALKTGRPTSVPELPTLPTTSEEAFFGRAKLHLSRKELAADKPAGSRRHTPYSEFLKCIHLFGAGILNKEELVLLLKGLFLQGHAPKTGVNATGGNHNQAVANDANELMLEFEELLIGRGPYADQQNALKDRSKYGSLRIRDFDFGDVAPITPSYRPYPNDYPHALFLAHPGQNQMDAMVLNEDVVCVDPLVGEGGGTRKAEQQRKRKMSPSIEESDGAKMRHNVYEEALFRIEDERYELDMAIERNSHALLRIEPFATEAHAFREQEEKDGQPIGRLRYQLHRYSLNTIHINAIGRIYGDRGDEILQHLVRNPLIVLPIVYERLKQKDAEWRSAKAELSRKWNAATEANYEGSMDHQCYFNRRLLEKSFAPSRLLDQCMRAQFYAKHPEKVKDYAATRAFAPMFLKRGQPGSLIYQPYIEVKCQVSISHKHAFQMIVHKLKGATDVSALNRERIGRLWAEFIVPWFSYPAHWVLDELRDSFSGKLGPSVTKCKFVGSACLAAFIIFLIFDSLRVTTFVAVAPGQRVHTIFGDGIIASFTDGTAHTGPRYRVKLPFGLGHLSPSAILYAAALADSPHVRRDGVMLRDDAFLYKEKSVSRLDSRYKLLFATKKIYQFLRLYSLLCSLLSDTREHFAAFPQLDDPAELYITPLNKSGKKKKRRKMRKIDYFGLLLALKKVLWNEMSPRDFEALARKCSKVKVHEIAALPVLIDRCVDALVKMAEEDALLQLYDYCQYKNADPVVVRNQCLAIVPNLFYRIQYDTDAGTVSCCYVESGPMAMSPQEDEDDDMDDEMEGSNIDTGDGFNTEDDPIEEDDDNGTPEAKRARME
jgi:histone deacetylase complex regulatory component SIN3